MLSRSAEGDTSSQAASSDLEAVPRPEVVPPAAPFRPGSETALADALFVERWSPRAFLERAVSQEDVEAVLDAARWAPSGGNSQPWLFAYAITSQDRRLFASALHPSNRTWAEKAPVLIYLLARKIAGANGRVSPYPFFDSGAAWMSLALQARLRGLSTHAMAGFDHNAALKLLGLPRKEYAVAIAIALGYEGDPATLPKELAAREHPNGRKSLEEISHEGTFRGTARAR